GPKARPGGHGGKPGPQFGPPRGRGPGGPGHMSPGGKRGGPQHRGKPRR
ncbi:MAG: chitin-binding protein, partial [Opitutae bacterium]|nr:chitin-binding protein [Opitutae bacterium]